MSKKRPESVDPRLVKALAHPLRVRILEILTDRVASPIQLSGELEIGLSHVSYHTTTLDQCGCLELVDTARRRGATEHFYKAAPRSFIGDRSWRKVPRSIRGGVSGAALQTFMDKAVGALEAGTIESREDTVLSWMPVRLDQRGWEEVGTIMEDTLDQVLASQARSKRRLAKARGEEGSISAVVALASFETGGSQA